MSKDSITQPHDFAVIFAESLKMFNNFVGFEEYRGNEEYLMTHLAKIKDTAIYHKQIVVKELIKLAMSKKSTETTRKMIDVALSEIAYLPGELFKKGEWDVTDIGFADGCVSRHDIDCRMYLLNLTKDAGISRVSFDVIRPHITPQNLITPSLTLLATAAQYSDDQEKKDNAINLFLDALKAQGKDITPLLFEETMRLVTEEKAPKVANAFYESHQKYPVTTYDFSHPHGHLVTYRESSMHRDYIEESLSGLAEKFPLSFPTSCYMYFCDKCYSDEYEFTPLALKITMIAASLPDTDMKACKLIEQAQETLLYVKKKGFEIIDRDLRIKFNEALTLIPKRSEELKVTPKFQKFDFFK